MKINNKTLIIKRISNKKHYFYLLNNTEYNVTKLVTKFVEKYNTDKINIIHKNFNEDLLSKLKQSGGG